MFSAYGDEKSSRE